LLKERYRKADQKLKEETDFNQKAVAKYDAIRGELSARTALQQQQH
jgi:hypothetical protein